MVMVGPNLGRACLLKQLGVTRPLVSVYVVLYRYSPYVQHACMPRAGEQVVGTKTTSGAAPPLAAVNVLPTRNDLNLLSRL